MQENLNAKARQGHGGDVLETSGGRLGQIKEENMRHRMPHAQPAGYGANSMRGLPQPHGGNEVSGSQFRGN